MEIMEIKVEQVSKHFGAKRALRNVSLKLGPGITALLGRNGSGKSTLLRMLATISLPSEGKIFFNGTDIQQNPTSLRQVLGYLPQEFGLYPNMTPVEFLQYMAAMKSLPRRSTKRRIDDLLDVLNLSGVRNRKIGGFSGGMRQRVGIAQALLNDPQVLIVDEPTVGLDPEERMSFRNLVSAMAADRIILLSTHIVSDIEAIAPRIAILSGGALIADTTPDQLLRQAEDRVWECQVPFAELPRLHSSYSISQAITGRDGLRVRIVADEKPSFIGTATATGIWTRPVKVAPSLEDAYLYVISKESGSR